MAVSAALPSTLPAVSTNLINLLQASAAMTGVDISWGGPTQAAPDEMIAFEVQNSEITTAAIGSQRRTEQYDLLIHIAVNQNDPEAFNPLLRTFALRDAIASIIRADATVGGAVMWALDQGWILQDGSDGNWSGTQVTMTIHCYARI